MKEVGGREGKIKCLCVCLLCFVSGGQQLE